MPLKISDAIFKNGGYIQTGLTVVWIQSDAFFNGGYRNFEINQKITSSVDNSGGNYKINTDSTLYLSDGDIVVIEGKYYTIYTVVLNTSFDISGADTGLDFSNKIIEYSKLLNTVGQFGNRAYKNVEQIDLIIIDSIENILFDEQELANRLNKTLLQLTRQDYIDEIIKILEAREPNWVGKITIV